MKFIITALGKDGKPRKLEARDDAHRQELYSKLKSAGYKIVKLLRVDETNKSVQETYKLLKHFILDVLNEDVETKKVDVTSKSTQTVTPDDAKAQAAAEDDEDKDLLLDKLTSKLSELDESAPDGWEDTVVAMKKHNNIDNPWALAHSMKKKGYKSHK